MSLGPSTDSSVANDTLRFGFPKQHGASLSYWLENVQDDPLLKHRSTPELPASSDIVIIGSGITGSLVAKNYIETWPEKKVVVLEAREFCSGATGRNAGHCKPDQWRGFLKYEKAFGPQQALEILQNEQQTWSDLVAYVRENNVDCDLWVGDTLDVPVTQKAADNARDIFERYRAAGGNVDHIKVTLDPAKAAEISLIKDAKACYAWPASTLYPWKLVAHVMRASLNKGVNLQTFTKASRVSQSPNDPEKWIVQTERGDIESPLVVHATNAYSSALEPSLRGIIIPSPHMCNKIVPPEGFINLGGFKNSYGVLLSDGALISINHRGTIEGPALFGGSNPGQPEFKKWLDAHPEECIDDGLVDFKSVTHAVQHFTESQLTGWTADRPDEASRYKPSWSGIIALSTDGVPLIGELPGLPGQWICAGHNGHGMARTFTAAPGLVKLINGASWAETKLPDVYQITAERISRLKEQVLEGPVSLRI